MRPPHPSPRSSCSAKYSSDSAQAFISYPENLSYRDKFTYGFRSNFMRRISQLFNFFSLLSLQVRWFCLPIGNLFIWILFFFYPVFSHRWTFKVHIRAIWRLYMFPLNIIPRYKNTKKGCVCGQAFARCRLNSRQFQEFNGLWQQGVFFSPVLQVSFG